jgi:hypothetical protein
MPTLATAPNEHSTAKLARPANQRQPLSLRSQYVSLLLNVNAAWYYRTAAKMTVP